MESIEECREQAELCVRVAREVSGVDLDYSAASLSRLDAIIQQGWHVGDGPEQVIAVIGCYLGETIIRQLGGRWSWDDAGLGVRRPHVRHGRQHLNVIGKVAKRFHYGQTESLAAYFEMVTTLGPVVREGDVPRMGV